MIFPFLARRGLVAVKAVHSLARVNAHLVLMNDGILRAGMAFRAFSRGANQIRAGLFRFNAGTGAIEKECRQYESEGNDDGQKHSSKRHETSGRQKSLPRLPSKMQLSS